MWHVINWLCSISHQTATCDGKFIKSEKGIVQSSSLLPLSSLSVKSTRGRPPIPNHFTNHRKNLKVLATDLPKKSIEFQPSIQNLSRPTDITGSESIKALAHSFSDWSWRWSWSRDVAGSDKKSGYLDRCFFFFFKNCATPHLCVGVGCGRNRRRSDSPSVRSGTGDDRRWPRDERPPEAFRPNPSPADTVASAVRSSASDRTRRPAAPFSSRCRSPSTIPAATGELRWSWHRDPFIRVNPTTMAASSS